MVDVRWKAACTARRISRRQRLPASLDCSGSSTASATAGAVVTRDCRTRRAGLLQQGNRALIGDQHCRSQKPHAWHSAEVAGKLPRTSGRPGAWAIWPIPQCRRPRPSRSPFDPWRRSAMVPILHWLINGGKCAHDNTPAPRAEGFLGRSCLYLHCLRARCRRIGLDLASYASDARPATDQYQDAKIFPDPASMGLLAMV